MNLLKHLAALLSAAVVSAFCTFVLFALIYPDTKSFVPLPTAVAGGTLVYFAPGIYVVSALCWWMIRWHMRWKVAETDSGAAQALLITLVIILVGALTLALLLRYGILAS